MPAAHPFLSGLAGGLIGASVAHMLFGSGGFGGGFGMGMGGGGSPGLLHFLILGALIWFAYRIIKSLMGNRQGLGLGMPMAPLGYNNAAGAPLPVSQPLALTEDDRSAFGQEFLAIQSAWSDRDFIRLQRLMTPEMVSYFNEQLSANMSQGLINLVEQVQIQGIDLVEAWQENGMAYASVVIKWTAKDYMVRADRHPGDPDYNATPGSGLAALDQEQWTFVRAQSGGHWLLSAIQQM
jgi:predicted lipid-binding transport protein (Tim44 family)